MSRFVLSATFNNIPVSFNVELCVSRLGYISYLFRYVCKGSDLVTVQMVQGKQHYYKIGQIHDAQYSSASEALSGIFQFEFIDKYPPFVRLYFHVDDHHTVYFKERHQDRSVQRSIPGTKITVWSNANRT